MTSAETQAETQTETSKSDISTATVTADAKEFSGKTMSPDIKVTLGGVDLVENTDYKVIAPAVLPFDTGSYTYTIEGMGAFEGQSTVEFKVIALDASGMVIDDLKIDDQKYTGTDVEPAAPEKLTLNNGLIATKDVDYVVTYANNVNAGTATRTITFKGNFTGVITTAFTITAEAESLYTVEVDESAFAYTGSAFTNDVVKKAIKVINKNTLKNKDFSVSLDKVVTNAGDTFKLTVTVDGDKLVDAQEYTIAKRDISTFTKVEDTTTKMKYDGTQQKPAAIGTLKAENGIVALLNSSNVEIASYGANVNAGTGTYVLKVKDSNKNMTGSVEVTFAIDKGDVSSVYVMPIDPQTYNGGKEIKPVVKVYNKNTVSGTAIDLGQFDITYKDNKTVGTATITLTGTKDSNYAGSQSVTFTVKAANIADTDVAASTIPYNGEVKVLNDAAIKAGKYFQVFLNGQEIKDTEYTFDSIKTDSLGEVTVTVRGNGSNFTGTKTVKTVISRVALETEGKYTSSKKFTYSADEVKPDAAALGTLVYTDKDNKEDATKKLRYNDYKVIGWTNNVIAGKATAVIQGTGNFDGTATVEFEIEKLDLSKASAVAVKGLKDVESAGGTTTALVNSGLTVEVTVDGKKVVLPADTYTAIVPSTIGNMTTVTIKGVDDTSVTGENIYTVNATDYKVAPKVTIFNLANATVEVASIPYKTSDLEGKLQSEYVTVKTTAGVTVDKTAYKISDVVYSDAKLPIGTEVTFKIIGQGGFATGQKVATTTIGKPSIKDNCNVVFTAAPNFTYTGGENKPAVKVTNHLGAVLELDKDYTITYANNTNATTKDQKATAVITGKGDYVGTTELTFEIKKADLSSVAKMKAFSLEDTQYTGKALDLSQKAVLELTDSKSKYVLSASDYTVKATTDENAPAIKVGEKASVEFKAAENSNYTGVITSDYSVTARNIKTANVTFDKASYEYTGEAIKPVVTVKVELNGETVTLKEGTDYTVAFANNIKVPEKDAKQEDLPTVIVRAMSGSCYTDSISKTFSITASSSILKDYKIGAPSNVVYNGEAKEATVTKNGEVADFTDLAKFDVVYKKDGEVIKKEDVKNVGTYTATIVGKGNYSGEGETTTFTIKAKTLTKADIAAIERAITLGDVSYSGDATKAPVITVNSIEKWMVKENFFVDTYDKDFSENFKNYAAGETRNATVKINSENGNLIYADSIKEEFKLRQGNISKLSDYFTIDPQEYTSRAIEPELKAVEGSGVSAEWITEKTYSDNVAVSKNTAKVQFSGRVPENQKYTGYFGGTMTFAIVGANISKAEISGIKNGTYSGKPITLNPVVTFDGEALKLNKDYTLTYKDNTNAGTASVIITGKGNFAKSVTKKYTINQAAQTIGISANVEKILKKRYLNSVTYTLKPTGVKTAVAFKSSNSKVVAVSSKGTLTYKGVGKATITITAKANQNYKAATKVISITVYPKKPAATSITSLQSLKAGTVNVKAKKVSGMTGYQIKYSTDKSFTTGVKSVTVRTSSLNLNKTLTKLSSGKTYYVQVRTFKTTGTYSTFGAFSAVKSVKVK